VTEPATIFNKREIVLFALAMIVATVVTIEGTYLLLRTFVLFDPNDPGGLSTEQTLRAKGK
jgi:hypothetical protein